MLLDRLDFSPSGDVIVFIHSPKTGGSSLAAGLEEAVGPEHHLPLRMHLMGKVRERAHHAVGATFTLGVRQIKGSLTGRHWLVPKEFDSARLPQVRAISGHVQLGREPKTGRRPIYVTLVRDPVDRFVSSFYFFRSVLDASGPKARRTVPRLLTSSIDDYVDWLASRGDPEPFNVQCLHVAGRPSFAAARKIIDEQVFLAAALDDMEAFRSRLGAATGLAIAPRREKVGSLRASAPPPRPETIEKLKVLTAEDRQLYDHIRAEFHRL